MNENRKEAMRHHLRSRFWLEVILAGLSVVLTIVAFTLPDWIERVAPWSPDHGTGQFELGLALLPAALAIVSSWLATREWKRALRPSIPGDLGEVPIISASS
jgi:hypothetical protein